MHSEALTTADGVREAPREFRRLFFIHVGTVVLTASIVAPMLIGFASIPPWLSVTYCVVIIATAMMFFAAATRVMQANRHMPFVDRIQCLTLTFCLSVLQVVFALPLLICVFAPEFRA